MMKQMLSFTILATLLFSTMCGDSWKRAYLATFPRSGNHWVRYLVEEATHVATSSVYRDRDPPHLKWIFPWGGFCTNRGYEGECRYPRKTDTVFLKTHSPAIEFSPRDGQPSIKTIRIVRHPIDSFYSFYIYRLRGKSEASYVPKEDVKEFIVMWRRFQEYWNQQPNVLTFRYEDMLNGPAEILTQILSSTGYRVTDQDIQRAVDRYPPIGSPLKHKDKFRPADLKLIVEQLADLMIDFGYDID